MKASQGLQRVLGIPCFKHASPGKRPLNYLGGSKTFSKHWLRVKLDPVVARAAPVEGLDEVEVAPLLVGGEAPIVVRSANPMVLKYELTSGDL